MLSDDDSLFGEDSDSDVQTSVEIPKLALPSLKRKSVTDSRDDDGLIRVGTSALSASPLPVAEQAAHRHPTEFFPPMRSPRGDGPQPTIPPSLEVMAPIEPPSTAPSQAGNKQHRQKRLNQSASQSSGSVPTLSRPARSARRRAAQPSNRPPNMSPPLVPTPLAEPEPHLQPLLHVLRSDESVTSILTALLAHLKEDTDRKHVGRRLIKRRRLDSFGREISEEEWRILRTKHLVAILSSALKRAMDRIRLAEAFATTNDPATALNGVMRTAQDEMEYQRTIGKWLVDKELVQLDTTPLSTPGPSTPGSAPHTNIPLVIDPAQAKQMACHPMSIGLPPMSMMNTSSVHGQGMIEEAGLGLSSGDEYWSELVRLLDNFGAAEPPGVSTARPENVPTSYSASASSTIGNDDFFTQLMQLGHGSSSIDSPFDGASTILAPSLDSQSLVHLQTAATSDRYASMHFDPSLMSMSDIPLAATSITSEEYPTATPFVTQMAPWFDRDPSALSNVPGAAINSVSHSQNPADSQAEERSDSPNTNVSLRASEIPNEDVHMAMGIPGSPAPVRSETRHGEGERSAKSKGKRREVVWADEVTLGPISICAQSPRSTNHAPEVSAVAAQQDASRKTRMRSVLDRARVQRQKMREAMDDALRQLWELEIEHATLAKVVKGVTMKEALLSKKKK
ncbi:hypothetical protein FRB93_006162 [Tulasnella sp. JGI-2019a]|nr:hypothetical protein FRB93_006162 [Tulasnella sp. JGI-2019a]